MNGWLDLDDNNTYQQCRSDVEMTKGQGRKVKGKVRHAFMRK